jgi:hypothetical protein
LSGRRHEFSATSARLSNQHLALRGHNFFNFPQIGKERLIHGHWASPPLRGIGDLKSRAKDHRHYVIGQMIEILSVRPESLLANRATGDNHALAALSVPHDLCFCISTPRMSRMRFWKFSGKS